MKEYDLYPGCKYSCKDCDFSFFEGDDQVYSCEIGNLHALGFYNKYEEADYEKYGEEALTKYFKDHGHPRELKLYPKCNGHCEKCFYGLCVDDNNYTCDEEKLKKYGYYNMYQDPVTVFINIMNSIEFKDSNITVEDLFKIKDLYQVCMDLQELKSGIDEALEKRNKAIQQCQFNEDERKNIDILINKLDTAKLHKSDYEYLSKLLKDRKTDLDEHDRYAEDDINKYNKTIYDLASKVMNYIKEKSEKDNG